MATGIDFGTTNSVVAQWNGIEVEVLDLDIDHLDSDWFYPSFESLFPSVAGQSALRPGILYGWEAKLRSQHVIEACKRMLKSEGGLQIGARRFPATTVAAGVFSAMRERARSRLTEIDSSVITVPANAKGGARFRTRAAATAAGIQVKALLNEPTAAALAYTHYIQQNGTIMVFDWGGGTIDVTVLEHIDGFFHEKASRGITQLGGIEIDERIRDLIIRKNGRVPELSTAEERNFALAVERTKIRLSVEESVLVNVGSRTVQVTRDEIESVIGDLVERALQPIRMCLNDLGIDPIEIDDILMIGGTSQMPCVRQAVERLMDDETVDPRLCEPMTAVARGAALAAAIFDREIDSVLRVSSMYALGTSTTDKKTGKKVFSTIVPERSPLPIIREKSYTPIDDFRPRLSIPVWEADPEKPLDDEENFQLTTLRLEYPRPLPREEAEFLLKYTYTDDGLLKVKATLAKTCEVVLDQEVKEFTHGGSLSPEEIKLQLRELSLTPPLRVSPSPLPSAFPQFSAAQSAPLQQVNLAPETATPTPPTSSPRFVIDGSNIAWLRTPLTRGERPSLAQLVEAITALKNEHPGASVDVFVDPALRHQLDEAERPALQQAISHGEFIQVAAGTHGKADRAVVELATRKNATIVTNDNYAEQQADFPWLFDKDRVLGIQYAGGIWMFLPRTPLRPRRPNVNGR
ncbi:Hsp70 family protein [Streptosporangium sp. LJ11]|uniref:Hsp70 family protein n=1 Tax=Streptosporangium sp. LJ11 TaxID=3436927 RepID=UPI003F78B1D7